MIRAIVPGLLLAAAAMAQPVQPVPDRTWPVADALTAAPQITLDNGRVALRIAPPDATKGFYRGTRFDQAGVVTSLKMSGREFYGPWFERTAPDVLDYVAVPEGIATGPDSAISGPVEEFAPLGFAPAPGLFVKIGVGVLRQPDTAPYDHYRHYEIVDGGTRTMRVTRDSVTFIQALSGAGYGYVYEKTLRLVPGKPELVIEHHLRNTGENVIDTTVYDHNFLRLVRGNDGVKVRFPFTLSAPTPPPADLIALKGDTLAYLRPFRDKERVSFLLTGFGTEAADYHFDISASDGAGVTVSGDAPLTRLNVFSIDRVQAVEPYIAVTVAPGAEKSWRYRYQYRSE